MLNLSFGNKNPGMIRGLKTNNHEKLKLMSCIFTTLYTIH